MRLSGSLCTFNEEQFVRRTLENLWRVCDEVVVFDSFSTDSTLQILADYKCKVTQHVYDSCTMQKNRALAQCQGDWNLHLDADEYLNNNAIKNVFHIIRFAEDNGFDAVNLPRLNLVDGKECNNWPDLQTRLLKRGVYYDGPDPLHQQLLHDKHKVMNVTDKSIGYIIHDKTLEKQKRNNRYYYQYDPSRYPTCPEGCEDIWKEPKNESGRI